MPAIKKRKTSECLAEGCSFHAIGDGQKNLDENMMDHYLDIMRHLSNSSSIKESHHLKFHRCSFCQKVFIKHKKNFNAHVSHCSANTPLAQGHILPQEDPFRRYQGPICMPVEEHISTNPRSSHAIASHAQMSKSGKMFSGTHEYGYPTVKSRFLHTSPKKVETTRRSVASLPQSPEIQVDDTHTLHHRNNLSSCSDPQDRASQCSSKNSPQFDNFQEESQSLNSSDASNSFPDEVSVHQHRTMNHDSADECESFTFSIAHSQESSDDDDLDRKLPAPISSINNDTKPVQPGLGQNNYTFVIPPGICGHDTNESPIDFSVLEYVKKIRSHRRTKAIKTDYLPYLSILKKATRSGVPDNLYDDIARDIHKHFNSNSSKLHHPSRQVLTKYLSDFVHPKSLQHMSRPRKEKLVLPSGRTVILTLFDIRYQLALLFSDSSLMKPENFVFPDGLNPFELPDYDGPLGEINSGLFHEYTSKLLCPEGSNKFLMSFLAFIDGAMLKSNSIEPITLCPAIFRRFIRNLDRPWIVLGYIEPECNYIGEPTHPDCSTHNIPQHIKLADYHAIIRRIFQDFRELQKSGLEIDMPGKGQCTAVPVLQAVISDCKAGDNFTCRYASHTLKVKGLVRDCDCKTVDGQDHKHHCKYHLNDFMKHASEEQLRALSFHKIFNNAFHEIYFGYCEVFGVYGATPPEALHVFRIGICVYLFEGFVKNLSGKMKVYLNKLSKEIVFQICRHGNGAYADVDCFRHGIFHKKLQMSGAQKFARIFVLYCCMMKPVFVNELSKSFKQSTHISEGFTWSLPIVKEWTKLLECTVGFDSWLRSEHQDREPFFSPNFDPEHPEKNVEDMSAAQSRVRQYMKLLKKCVNRTKGSKLLLTKFHHLLHFVHYARIHGIMLNFDGSRQESNGKTINKAPGARTQNVLVNLTFDTATKYIEYKNFELFSTILQSCFPHEYERYDLKSKWIDTVLESRHDKYEVPRHLPPSSSNSEIGGSRFDIMYSPLEQFSPDFHGLTIKWKTIAYNLWGDDLLASVERCLFSGSTNKVIFKGFTQYRCPIYEEDMYEPKLNTVKAHPSFRSSAPWYSWVSIAWEDVPDQTAVYPAKVFMFFDTTGCCDLNGHGFLKPDCQYAIIQSCVTKQASRSTGSQLKTQLITPLRMETHLQIVETGCIEGCVLVIEHSKIGNSSYLVETASLLKFPWELVEGHYQ